MQNTPPSPSRPTTGSSDRTLSDSLTRHLRQRGRQAGPFCIGEWLATLPRAQVALIEDVLQSPRHASLDDVLKLTIIAVDRETPGGLTDKPSPDQLQAWITRLLVAVKVENLRRLGWAEPIGTIALLAKAGPIAKLTPAGEVELKDPALRGTLPSFGPLH